MLVELGLQLQLPAFTREDGTRKFKNYTDFIINYENTAPGSGIGFLAGWRGKDGEKSLRGEPNPDQWNRYAKHDCFFHYEMPKEHQFLETVTKVI